MTKTSHAYLEAEYRELGEESFSPLLDGYDPDEYEGDLKAVMTSRAGLETQKWEVGIDPSGPAPGENERDQFDEDEKDNLDEDPAAVKRELNDPFHWLCQTIERNFGGKALLTAEQEKALARDVEPMRHYRRLEEAIRGKVDDEADPRRIAGELVRELVRRIADASPMLWAAGLWLNLPMGTTFTEALEDPDLRAALDEEPEDEMIAFIADALNVNEEDVRTRLADLARDVSILPEKVLAEHGDCELRSLPEALSLIQADLTRGRDPAFYAWSFGEVVSRGVEARNKMVESNLLLVCRIARDHGRHRQRMDPDLGMDMIGAGSIGLLSAAEQFDHRRGTRFSTYATPCIRNEIRSFLDWDDGETVLPALAKTPTDSCPSVEEQVCDRIMFQSLMAETEKLPDRERHVIQRRHLSGDDKPPALAAVGKELGGISGERVRQIEEKALKKLRRWWNGYE